MIVIMKIRLQIKIIITSDSHEESNIYLTSVIHAPLKKIRTLTIILILTNGPLFTLSCPSTHAENSFLDVTNLRCANKLKFE